MEQAASPSPFRFALPCSEGKEVCPSRRTPSGSAYPPSRKQNQRAGWTRRQFGRP